MKRRKLHARPKQEIVSQRTQRPTEVLTSDMTKRRKDV